MNNLYKLGDILFCDCLTIPLKHEVHLNNIQKFNSNFTENTESP
jgi:hypothetical protein